VIAHALIERSRLPLEMAPREPPASPYSHSQNSAALASNPSNTTVRFQLNSTPLTSVPSLIPETFTAAMKSPKFLPVLKVFGPHDPRSLTGFLKLLYVTIIYYNLSVSDTKRLRWSRGSVLAFGTQARGFKPGRNRRIFRGENILSTPSLGGEVKPSVVLYGM
jgi:hypothetical protein